MELGLSEAVLEAFGEREPPAPPGLHVIGPFARDALVLDMDSCEYLAGGVVTSLIEAHRENVGPRKSWPALTEDCELLPKRWEHPDEVDDELLRGLELAVGDFDMPRRAGDQVRRFVVSTN